MQNGNFNYIMLRNTSTCNTMCTGGPSLEYEYLFYIVSVICSQNIMTCMEKGTLV